MSDNPISNFYGLGGGSQGDYNLGTPVSLESPAGKIKEEITKYDSRKRSGLSAGTITKEIEKAANLELGAEMLGMRVQAENRQLMALVRAYNSKLQQKTNVMRASQQLAKSDSRMAKELLKHQLGMGIQQAEVRGYQAAYNKASELFS